MNDARTYIRLGNYPTPFTVYLVVKEEAILQIIQPIGAPHYITII